MVNKDENDMWAHNGMICFENNHLFNLNHLEVAYITECNNTHKNKITHVVSLIFKSGREIERPFKSRELAQNFIEDLMGYYSVSFEKNDFENKEK